MNAATNYPTPTLQLTDDLVIGAVESGDEQALVQLGQMFGVSATALKLQGEEAIAERDRQAAANGETAIRPELIRLDTVKRETLRWLWPGRIPLGKLTVLAGDPGLGKSNITNDIISRITTGSGFPDAPHDRCDVGSAILMNAEDDLADTIGPRLDAAGADSSRVVALQSVKMAGESIPVTLANIAALERAIQLVPDCRLIVIDPVSAYLGKTDSHVNSDVRALLAPLAQLAGQYAVAIILVTHLRKGDGAAVYRAMGSLAFIAAARAGWCISKDAADPSGRRRLFLPIKSNLGADDSGLAFELRDSGSGIPQVVWEAGSVNVSADDALSSPRGKPGPEGEEQERAAAWLRTALANGPRLAKELDDEAKEGESISKATLRRAQKTIGAVAFREHIPGPWLWRMPETQDAQPDHLGPQ